MLAATVGIVICGNRAAAHEGLLMNAHGCKLDKTYGAVADYISKFGHQPLGTPWGVEAGMTKGHLKQGKGRVEHHKETEYQVVWSTTHRGYEVIHAPFSFPLKDTATLQHWLDRVDTFHFCSPTCHTLTVRKEAKQRGGSYWYAYKRVGGKVQKKYLGTKSKIALMVLEEVARSFVEPIAPPPEPQQPILRFTRTLASALHIYGFPTIPSKKALIARYRELSKKHHPDTGGLHEDMVAVNLAYDYLKKFVNDRR